jgi:Dolichyl-phosphate-mannose-protein mannosyltransferase
VSRPIAAYLSRSALLSGALLSGALVLPFILGAALRTWHLDALGYNSDEAVYAGQAAALAHAEPLASFFPAFRAHPLVVQGLLSLVYQVSVSEVAGRLLSVSFGLGTILLVYVLGRTLYTRWVGVVAAAFAATMPYLVVVNRQLLLDGPAAFFTTAALVSLALYLRGHGEWWVVSAGALLGVAILTKETSVLFLGAVYAFFVFAREVTPRLRTLLVAASVLLLIVAAAPFAQQIAGASQTGGSYLVWQLFRRPNHSATFYFTDALPAFGWPVLVLALLGLLRRRRPGGAEILLFSWIIIALFFFELWAVKGFQYLVPIAPAVCVLAARGALSLRELQVIRAQPGGTWRFARSSARGAVRPTARVIAPAAAVLFTLGWLSWASVDRIDPSPGTSFIAGSGGVFGGREAGHWLDRHSPLGSVALAIGPSMANLLQFYGHRRAFGLSVSPNVVHRNPAYPPVRNPDLLLRRGEIHYLVWDAYSAARTSYFGDRIRAYADRYDARAVHTETATVRTAAGPVTKPIIIIYQVGGA